jgi:hypothetical protein
MKLGGSVSASNASSSQMQDTPQPAQQHAAALDNLTSEKKRNKLGYHRTSVACGKSHPHPVEKKGYILECRGAKKLTKAIVDGGRSDASRPPPTSRGGASTASG